MAAASARVHLHFKFFSWLLLCLLSSPAYGSPLSLPTGAQNQLFPRGEFGINNATGTPQIFSPSSRQFIPQGPATDGSGTDFSPVALVWLAFCFVVGAPMALAGVRGWRLSTGVGIGLSMAVCSWAAIINSVNNIGVPDGVITSLVLAFFVIGCIFGLLEFGRAAGTAALGVTGGLAFGIRICILREGLLIPGLDAYPLNWLLIASFGTLGGAAIIWQKTQRPGILFGSASVGTFLVFLGVDLIINRQAGMSRGLRFLFDRNASHALDIVVGGYTPTLLTQILLAVSLALTPTLAYAQHCLFSCAFNRNPRRDSEIAPLDFETPKHANSAAPPAYGNNGMWYGKKEESSRFSV
ncbi:hypothetical protein H0H81_012649 [Sphagnurus paluster]|uniref:TM7S3/TM198-like domain-containing protein n=1 Tax=Sphagnurus paluster TaxID=117069 RepID=A0A9P7FTS0_9AGAR|nr:hypothetical protein H0H81_012649 [Sphagnurus paluster]